ncbi:MAG: GNAT family N-acetyltransferase [Elusimicrobia bacterium GWD2_63_28]|nr:MAG: GNAT family N-acetyltransferase [Elusimicrobia bacterium GWD2_63_28]
MKYNDDLKGVTARKLAGFFVGWPNPPAPATHLKLLNSSDLAVIAVDGASGRVVGFITAITDKVLSAYIPFLEVLPEYQGRGIGGQLVKRMLRKLKKAYMVDLICDPGLQKFYKNFEMFPATGMMLRNRRRQCGANILPKK